jgi:hypothetical protein
VAHYIKAEEQSLIMDIMKKKINDGPCHWEDVDYSER